MSYEKLCMHCMREHGTGFQHECPHCHFREDTASQLPPYLALRSIIGSKYLIGSALDTNGDSITYIAYDTEQNQPVYLHEFFPSRVVNRHSGSGPVEVKSQKEPEFAALKASFLELWGKLHQMQGLSALQQTLDLFEENNTVYAVTEYVQGSMSLRDYLLSSKNGYLAWKDARIMFMPVLSTLANLHSAGIIHRGISPATLLVYPDHKLHLTGFSIPEGRTMNSGLAAEVYPGYTPIEQLGSQSAAGPWTDIYSFAAVLYRTLTGKTPVEANRRVEYDSMKIPAAIAGNIPSYVIHALINALQVYPEERTRTIDTFRAELDGSRVAEMANEFKEEEKARKRRMYANRDAGLDQSTQAVEDISAMIEEPPMEPERKARRSMEATPNEGHSKGKGKFVFLVLAFLLLLGLLFGVLIHNLSGGGFNFGGTPDTEETVVVPDFVNQNASDVESKYNDIFVLNYKYENSADIAENHIIRQSIPKGSNVPKGTTITLTVSKGAEQIPVPDVRGKTYEDAKATLEAAGFRVSKVEKDNDGGKSAGTVADMAPSAGKSCNKGTTVTLQVWSQEKVTEPDTTRFTIIPTPSPSESQSQTESQTDAEVPEQDVEA